MDEGVITMIRLRMARGMFHQGSQSRNRALFVIGGLLIVGISAMFARATVEALQIRSATSSEFSQYVIDHHVGTVEESTDFSGFQGDFCVLQLAQRLPHSGLRSAILKYLFEYHTLDGGTHLTLDYQAPNSPHDEVLADAIYDQNAKTVTVNIHVGANAGLQTIPVDWTGSWYAN